ncbi:hypothetical protein PRIPAC_79032 [Pristionchus pacificus]|uniref:Uncharacterized protein n=1 Tax=Pristionchus pacificus TaxID=54126 RepID=A0A2A6BXC3_PRIPA|nr:hypothetical protein PRIPAC_79032 [Pristionchus pacificus]|eukprot:PDM70564.1 hypothetical protein PRIPAC_46810 [Pristionchus pacificus]
MPVNILVFPGNARAKSKILSYLDSQSSLRLREVCKSARILANLSIVLNQTTIVRSFECAMRQVYDNRLYAVMTIYFENRGKCVLWKSVLNRIIKGLQVSDFYMTEACSSLHATMRPEHVEHFFAYMKPLIGRTEFQDLSLSRCSNEIIRICSKFVIGKSISKICITCIEYISKDFNSYLHLLRDCKTDHLSFFPQLINRECIEWLSQISNLVKVLAIKVSGSSTTDISPLAIVRALCLEKSKCSEIHLTFYSQIYLSFSAIQIMLKLFHSSNKKIHISSIFKGDHIDLQVGLYQLKSFNIQMRTDVARYIIIKSLQAEFV